MSISEAKKRANEKWQKEHVEDIRLRVPKGKKARIQDHAARNNESVNAFINRAVDELMAKEHTEDENNPEDPA